MFDAWKDEGLVHWESSCDVLCRCSIFTDLSLCSNQVYIDCKGIHPENTRTCERAFCYTQQGVSSARQKTSTTGLKKKDTQGSMHRSFCFLSVSLALRSSFRSSAHFLVNSTTANGVELLLPHSGGLEHHMVLLPVIRSDELRSGAVRHSSVRRYLVKQKTCAQCPNAHELFSPTARCSGMLALVFPHTNFLEGKGRDTLVQLW